MNELDAAFSFIALTLTNDATLRALPASAPIARRWFRHVAPAIDPVTHNPMVYPVGILSHVASRDTRGVGQYRVLTVAQIDVKVVSKAGQDVSSAVNRMDALLDVPSQASPITSVVVDGVTYWLLGCSRRSPLSYADPPAADGVVYEHAGGTYDVTISR